MPNHKLLLMHPSAWECGYHIKKERSQNRALSECVVCMSVREWMHTTARSAVGVENGSLFVQYKLKQKSWNAVVKPVKKLSVQMYLMSTLLASCNSLICASTSIKVCVCVSRVTQTMCWDLVCCHKFTPSAFVHPSHSFCRFLWFHIHPVFQCSECRSVIHLWFEDHVLCRV